MHRMFFLIFSLFLGQNSFAFPVAPFDALKSDLVPPPQSELENYDFEGIVKLSNCSGAIVRFKGQPLSDNAIVLTNGHCLGGRFMKPGQVIHKKRTRRRMRVADGKKRFHRITSSELMYATMTDTDSALYRLRETFEELERKGIRAFELSDQRPQRGTSIEIISGYWERGYRCEIDEFIHELHEASWIFKDSIRYTNTGCQTIGGTSGSPIIQSGTKLVIGVNNTGNESGKRCTMNNPCEVDENNDVTVIKGASYGQQTYLFYTCLDSNFDIDLDQEGCQLPKG